ncbi:hypothetical protein DPMN_126780 [Dreissena polymorpha]|uniref:Uncharacterized protein n=1 Tax=Dreissena polymorpha TaxID=45954 RepID=A0A9D4GXP5_DREPO|nr:hypothetical protein DPMN_126780 [Dreissena polymorpha]
MALSSKENCPTSPGGQVLRPIGTIFELMKMRPPPRQPCFSTDQNHFQTQLSYLGNTCSYQNSWKLGKIVTFRVFTCFHYIHIAKNAPPTGGHFFLPIWTIFKLLQNIHKINVLTKFHDDWANNCDFLTVNCSVTLAAMLFQRTETIFDIFHEDWTKNVTSRVFTCFHYIHIEKTTIFELVRYIYYTNVLTKFHDDWATSVTSRVFTRKTATPTGGHVFNGSEPLFFELDRVIFGTNLLTKFHEGRTRNEASRVFTRFLYCQMKETAPPTGGHVFQRTGTTF